MSAPQRLTPLLALLVLGLAAAGFKRQGAPPPYRDPKLAVERRVADLVSRMTLEEKVAQLGALEWQEWLTDEKGVFSPEKAKPRLRHGIGIVGRPGWQRSAREAALYTNALQRYLVEETRLGIPALMHEELLHGLMAQGATQFPQAIALGSTWDEDLVRRVYAAAALETRARGSNWALTPDLDLAREPRWGRAEETMGEDPLLVSRLGAAAVRGMQGGGAALGADNVIATVKHFAAHGQPEGGTNLGPAPFGERELRSVFLRPFQAGVAAGALSVMASYNEIDGVPTHVNPFVLRTVLRDEWGFRGFVTSDGWAIPQLHALHDVTASAEESAREALRAGVDLQIEGLGCFGTLVAQVLKRDVPVTLVDAAVRRVLRAKMLAGLFERPYVDPDRAAAVTDSAEHRALALEAARKAIVLLKNDGPLPLDRATLRSLAVVGPNATGLHLGGYSWEPGRGVTILDGIRAVAGPGIEVRHAEGVRLTEGVSDWRAWYGEQPVRLTPDEENAPRIEEAVRLARASDAVVVVVGENEAISREAWSESHLGDRDELRLVGRQEELVRALLATGKPVVLVLVNGRALAIPELARSVPAILEAWYPGQEGGTALAEVLFGDVNPSGRLPVTLPRSVGQLPVY